jgi:hypothetical protein
MDQFRPKNHSSINEQTPGHVEIDERKKPIQEASSFDPLRDIAQKSGPGEQQRSNISDGNGKSTADRTPDATTRLSRITRGVLYGGSDRVWISSRDHRGLKQEVTASERLLDDAKKALGHTDEMWSKVIDPEDFVAKYQKVVQNQKDAEHHRKKTVTSRDTKGYLAQWEKEREDLSQLVKQFNKNPEQVRREVNEQLPMAVATAQGTLTRLESIGNWREQKGRLEKKEVLAFNLHRDRMKSHIQTYQGSDTIVTENEQARLLTELQPGTKIIAEFTDQFAAHAGSSQEKVQSGDAAGIATSSARTEHRLGWQGSSRETMEGLVRKVAQLDRSKYATVGELHDAIYEMYAINERQPGFSRPMDEKRYQTSLLGIDTPSGVGVELNGGFINFSLETNNVIESGNDHDMRRAALNIQPDHIRDVTQEIVRDVSALPYVSEVKTTYRQKEAIERLDNMVIYFSDPPGSGNKRDLEQRIRRHAPYTRPGHPAMMEPLDPSIQGIAFADQSKGKSFGDTRILPIAEAAWDLAAQGRQNDDRALLAEVERRMTAHGIDQDAPLWDI